MANTTNAKTVEIPVDKIQETQDNEYIFGIHDADIKRLAEEIKEHGFTGSIDVVEREGGMYQVFAGHQRLRAVKSLGWETIPCTVADPMSDEELMRKLLASNVLNRKISPLGYARAIDAYKNDVLKKEHYVGREREACAKFFNISSTQVQRYEALLKTTPYVQELCDKEEIPFYPFTGAVGFTQEQQEELERQIRRFRSQNDGIALSANLLNGIIWSIKNEASKKQIQEQLEEAQRKLEETSSDVVANASAAPEEGITSEEAGIANEEDLPNGSAVSEPESFMPAANENAESEDEKTQFPFGDPLPFGEEEPFVARAPQFNEEEEERLSLSASISGVPIEEGSGSDDLDFGNDDFAVPSPTISENEATDYSVIHTCDALVDLSNQECKFTSGTDVLAAIERCEAALKKIKTEIKNMQRA